MQNFTKNFTRIRIIKCHNENFVHNVKKKKKFDDVQEKLGVFTNSGPHHIDLYWNDEKNSPRSYSIWAVSNLSCYFRLFRTTIVSVIYFFDVAITSGTKNLKWWINLSQTRTHKHNHIQSHTNTHNKLMNWQRQLLWFDCASNECSVERHLSPFKCILSKDKSAKQFDSLF